MADTNTGFDWMAFLRQNQQQQPNPMMPMGGMPGTGMGAQPPLPAVGGMPPPGSLGPGAGAPGPAAPPQGMIQEDFAPRTPQRPMPSPENQMTMDLYSRLGALGPQEKEFTRQRALADQLRQGAAMPGMRQAGRTQQAANPLEFLSALGHAGLGEYAGGQADKKEKEYDEARARAFGGFREAQGFK